MGPHETAAPISGVGCGAQLRGHLSPFVIVGVCVPLGFPHSTVDGALVHVSGVCKPPRESGRLGSLSACVCVDVSGRVQGVTFSPNWCKIKFVAPC